MAAPLLTAHDANGHVHIIVGCNPLASARCTRSLEVGAHPTIVAPANSEVHYSLQKKIDEGKVKWMQKNFEDGDLERLGRDEVGNVVDTVFVTLGARSPLSAHISSLCRRLRIPVNVSDAPNLCTFTLLATHSDGPLQIGITTSSKGCKLASRIRREVAASLPPGLGTAVERLGTIRRRIWEEDHKAHDLLDATIEDEDAPAQDSTFNQLIVESDQNAAKTRRMRWLSQICEYWSLRRLTSITDADIETILQTYTASNPAPGPHLTPLSAPGYTAPSPPKKPLVILAGSGPGSPHLLTLATHQAIKTASLILADKLVPEPVLNLIPRRTTVHIARKFPGNADAAQEELLSLGLKALQNGQTVLRLKQGDPYVYGRGGEEYHFFREHGYTPIVLPGITSSLSAPLFAAIPPTHRSVADQVLICTGTGRKGAKPEPPPYIKTQTIVFLMALHRLKDLVESLTRTAEKVDEASRTNMAQWPLLTPCAVIERASCPDQRIIRSTLQHIVAAVEEEGSRPPGLLVVGWSCEVLKNTGGSKWVTEEGFAGLDELMNGPDVELTALINNSREMEMQMQKAAY